MYGSLNKFPDFLSSRLKKYLFTGKEHGLFYPLFVCGRGLTFTSYLLFPSDAGLLLDCHPPHDLRAWRHESIFVDLGETIVE